MTVSAAVILTVVTIIYIFLSIAVGYAITENKQAGLLHFLVGVLGGLATEGYAFYIFFTFPFPAITLVGTTGILTLLTTSLGSLAIYMILYSFGEFLYNSTHKPKTD